MVELPRPVRYFPGEVLLGLYRLRGPVINQGLGGYGLVYLLGPEANKFVFANSDAFSWRDASQTLVPVVGPTALIVTDGAEHRRRRTGPLNRLRPLKRQTRRGTRLSQKCLSTRR
jgi:cytochrome P450